MKYAAILTDAEFMNLVDYRIQLVRQNHIPYLEGAVP